jgi:hypothetical protein
VIDHFVVAACERARVRGVADEWLRPTLLGASFRAGDAKRAADLAKHIKLEGAPRWKLSSTLSDLAESIQQTEDLENRKRLQRVFDDLAPLAASAAGI